MYWDKDDYECYIYKHMGLVYKLVCSRKVSKLMDNDSRRMLKDVNNEESVSWLLILFLCLVCLRSPSNLLIPYLLFFDQKSTAKYPSSQNRSTSL
uniref:Uncharacterized protein n=1 Tax=Lepeophtheirus salmonis TaxID=72036 RepID=A0A0K2UJ72_LEPSM